MTIDLERLSGVCGGKVASKNQPAILDKDKLLLQLQSTTADIARQQADQQREKQSKVISNSLICEAGKRAGWFPQWMDCFKWASELK